MSWAPLLPPVGLLLWALYWVHSHGEYSMEIPSWAPYALGLAAFILGAVFHLSRVSFVALTGLGLYALMAYALQDNSVLNPDCLTALGAVIIPVNILLFFCLPDRGAWSKSGILRLWIVFFEFMVLLLAAGLIPHGNILEWFFGAKMLGVIITMISMIYLMISERRPGRMEGPAFALTLGSMLAVLIVGSESVTALHIMNGVLGCEFIYMVFLLTWEYSFFDDLTQLPSRKTLNHRLAQLSGPFAVAMVDVDHFKKINDTYGHDVGDQVLKYIASHLKAIDFGTAYRYGGEEFAIISTGRDKEALFPLCDQFRTAVTNRPFILRGQRSSAKQFGRQSDRPRKIIPVTVSIGLAQSSLACRGPQEVIIEADKMLYRAKQHGRNRVECVNGKGRSSKRRHPAS